MVASPQFEFSCPLTPLLIAVLHELQRLVSIKDFEALDAVVEIIQPLLKPCSSRTKKGPVE